MFLQQKKNLIGMNSIRQAQTNAHSGVEQNIYHEHILAQP